MSFEKSLLSHLTTPESVARANDLGLRSNAFEDPTNQQVFEFIIKYWQDNALKEVPPETVLEHEFPAYKPEPGEESLTWLVGTLQKRITRNGLEDAMLAASEDLEADPLVAATNLSNAVWAIKESTAPRFNRVEMSENTEERKQRYVDRVASGDLDMGMTYGLDEIDEHTGGVQAGELSIIVAATGVGKSFKLTHAAYQARAKGFTPIIFTLEQSIEEFEDRIDCWASGVGYGLVSRGKMNPSQHQQHMKGMDELADLGKIYVESPERGQRGVVDLVNRARQVGADYIIIDQLSHMDARPSRYQISATEKNSEIIFDLKDEINRESSGRIPCLMAVQFNREASASIKVGEKPELRQIANSSDIERTVDSAFSLYRTAEMRANKTMVFDTMKARRSDTEAWLLGWELNKVSQITVRGIYEPEPAG